MITKANSLSVGKGGVLKNTEFIVPTKWSSIDVSPKKDMLIIQMIPPAEMVTKSGIVIPETLQSQFKDLAIKGIIVRIGKDLINDYVVGQVVILGNPPNNMPRIDGIDYSFIYESQIIGIYDNLIVEEFIEKTETVPDTQK